MIEREAVRSFELGGPTRLAEYLAKLDHYYATRHHLTDGSGRDLVDGGDWSSIVPSSFGPPRPVRASRWRPCHLPEPRTGTLSFHYYFTPPARPVGHPAVLRGGRADHRGAGLRLGRPPGLTVAAPPPGGRPLRRRRPGGEGSVGAEGRDRRTFQGVRRDGRPDPDATGGRASAAPGRLARAEDAAGEAPVQPGAGQVGRADRGAVRQDREGPRPPVQARRRAPGADLRRGGPRLSPPGVGFSRRPDRLAGRGLLGGGRGEGVPLGVPDRRQRVGHRRPGIAPPRGRERPPQRDPPHAGGFADRGRPAPVRRLWRRSP